MDLLPNEIWTEIILYLPVRDLLKFNITCHYFHKIVKEYKITDYKYGHKISLKHGDLPTLGDQYNFKSYSFYHYHQAIDDDKFKHLSNIHELYIETDSLTDQSMIHFTQLTLLDLMENDHISDESIKLLTNLKKLALSGVPKVTDQSIKLLTELRKLNLVIVDHLTGDSFSNLINLEDISLLSKDSHLLEKCFDLTKLSSLTLHSNEYYSQIIPNVIIRKLTQLKKLTLSNYSDQPLPDLNPLINIHTLDLNDVTLFPNCFDSLTHLRKLKIDNYNIIDGIFPIHLTKLELGLCTKITDESLKYLSPSLCKFNEISELKLLTNLRSLKVNIEIDNLNEIISSLSNLRTLSLYEFNNVTDNTIRKLTNLRKLTLLYNHHMTNESIKLLTHLIEFNLKIDSDVLKETVHLFNNWYDFFAQRIPIIEKLPNIQRFRFVNNFDVNKTRMIYCRDGVWRHSNYLIDEIINSWIYLKK